MPHHWAPAAHVTADAAALPGTGHTHIRNTAQVAFHGDKGKMPRGRWHLTVTRAKH